MPVKGQIFVVSAPSGAGKTSLCRAVTDALDNLTHSVSTTTRKPRTGEIDGRDYFFVTEDRFRSMVEAGDFVEWAEVHGNLYGTSRRMLEDLVDRGSDVILDIDTQGAKQIKEKFDSPVFIFIMPPSLEILEERLRNRRSDRDDEINRRMARARDEIRDFRRYDFIVVNRDFDKALHDLRSIIIAARCRTELLDPDWIKRLQ